MLISIPYKLIMDDATYRKNLALYTEKTNFGARIEGEITKALRVQSLSKDESTAKMLIKFEIRPEWVNEQQFVPPGLLISLFDVSSAIFHFYIDSRHATSVSIGSSILGTASLKDEIFLELTLQKFSSKLFNIKSTILCNGKIIAKCQHTKLLLNNTCWIPKL